MDFLPRGEGVVTRRPLELRLVHLSPNEHPAATAWAVFDAVPDTKFTDFSKVKAEIERQTDLVAGKNKGIVDKPIILTVYGVNCPDLTIIDLPGITRVPLKDTDQNEDIETLTRNMAFRYANDPRTIVLAVIPANQDISTSDALQLARSVDHKGVRTIGVITKVDLMDRGTDAARMLRGDDIPLRLGYIGVKLRSQKDIKEGKSVQSAIESEREFFSTHPVYRGLNQGLQGTRTLTQKLTKVLFRHIRNFLPEIKHEVTSKCRGIEARLCELGDGAPIRNEERTQLMWTLVTDYCEIYKNIIRGKYDKRLTTYFEGQDLIGGAHIRQIFNDMLTEHSDRRVTHDMSDYDIDLAIRRHEGDSLPGFPSPDTFEYLLLPHMKQLHSPVMECLDRVAAALELMSSKVAERIFNRFPGLEVRVMDLSQQITQLEKEKTKEILANYIHAETGYLFTNDRSYLSFHAQMGTVLPTEMQENNTSPPDPSRLAKLAQGAGQVAVTAQQSVSGMWPSPPEETKPKYSIHFINEIRQRLDGYFEIVIRNIRDSVPKIIGCFLVRSLQDTLLYEMYHKLNDQEELARLLSEPDSVREERTMLSTQLDTLRKAMAVLHKDPSLSDD
ncbi:MAG: LOW QUALITY PROTEIN: hypothetical protein KVP17_002434 [Porospora cf. gigantea B]|uniref:uncharacterized protein n=1 Tax=Porospora cf. gigantea B TaxID=2853592 RepID=UPI003571BFB4|nr:MAG: LOW QUALITY PROTEIN: hypothetical protein KVP17_002434 [Porospora cf. gigantea B]